MRGFVVRVQPYPQFFLAALALAAFLLSYYTRVSYTGSDSQLSLLVSQAILEHGTIALDVYQDRTQLTAPFQQLVEFGTIQHFGGHYYYLFPTGPSVLALPAVFVANLLGKDMALYGDNRWLQHVLAGLICALSLLLVYKIARCYLRSMASLVITTIVVFGSALISTMGSAYWNTDPAVLFILLSLWFLARFESGQSATINGYLFGLLLFAAYFCRPTAAIYIGLVLLYLLFKERRIFLQAAGVSFACFVLFLLWSYGEYGQPFPLYYRPARLQAVRGGLLTAVYGLLLSPSRGLFVYSPFFLITILGLAFTWRHLWRRPLFWLALLWFVLHLPVPGRTTRWWGGHAFGPRLLTEIIPALLILTVLVWESAKEQTHRFLQRAGVIIFVVLGAIAIFVNSGRGLYSHMPSRWNVVPNVDRYPQYLFDWRYPQFLATAETLQARYQEHVHREWEEGTLEVAAYHLGERMAANGEPPMIFIGWQQGPEYTSVAETRSPVLLFRLEQQPIDSYEIHVAYHSAQAVTVSLNGAPIGTLSPTQQPQREILPVGPSLLHNHELNELSFAVPAFYLPAVGYLQPPQFQLFEIRLAHAATSTAAPVP